MSVEYDVEEHINIEKYVYFSHISLCFHQMNRKLHANSELTLTIQMLNKRLEIKRRGKLTGIKIDCIFHLNLSSTNNFTKDKEYKISFNIIV